MTAEERKAKLFLEGAVCEFFEAVLLAGRHRLGSDNFTFDIEFKISAQEADRAAGVRLGEDIQAALDVARTETKVRAQTRTDGSSGP
jgi:hypothetical protein